MLRFRVLGVMFVVPFPCFVSLDEMFRRNIEWDISAGSESKAMGTTGRKTYQGIFSR